jgi:hypothetical protein
MAWLSSFLFRTDLFVFDFPHSARDICGYMICGAQGFCVLCPFFFFFGDEQRCVAGLGHHRILHLLGIDRAPSSLLPW